jgi:sugar phosphate isomerase/epimerase
MFNPELQQQIKAAAQKHSLEIASLAMGVLNDIPLKSDPRAEQWVAESIGIAKALGVKVILLAFFSNGDLNNDPKGVDSVVNKLINLAPAAEQAGVLFALESWLSAADSMKILERVGSPAVKVYYDVGNSQHMGYDIYKEIRTLGKERICEFHAKDYDDLYGKGSIRFDEVRKAMDEIGYEGWIQVEGIKTPLGLEQSLLADLEYLRGIFG